MMWQKNDSYKITEGVRQIWFMTTSRVTNLNSKLRHWSKCLPRCRIKCIKSALPMKNHGSSGKHKYGNYFYRRHLFTAPCKDLLVHPCRKSEDCNSMN